MSPPRDIELGGEVKVNAQTKVLCTCGQWVILGETEPSHDPIALHPMPQCQLFKQTDLLDYVRTLRQHYEGN